MMELADAQHVDSFVIRGCAAGMEAVNGFLLFHEVGVDSPIDLDGFLYFADFVSGGTSWRGLCCNWRDFICLRSTIFLARDRSHR